MDELDDFVRRADAQLVRLSMPAENFGNAPMTATLMDAVRLPIAALALVSIGGVHARGFTVSSMGTLVGATLVRAYPQFRRVGRRLEWSLRVRRTCAEALTFLESAGFVIVSDVQDGIRSLGLTPRGRSFLRAVKEDASEVGDLVKRLVSAAEMVRIEEVTLL